MCVSTQDGAVTFLRSRLTSKAMLLTPPPPTDELRNGSDDKGRKQEKKNTVYRQEKMGILTENKLYISLCYLIPSIKYVVVFIPE